MSDIDFLFLAGSSGVGKTSILKLLSEQYTNVETVRVSARDVHDEIKGFTYEQVLSNTDTRMHVQNLILDHFVGLIRMRMAQPRPAGQVLVFERSPFDTPAYFAALTFCGSDKGSIQRAANHYRLMYDIAERFHNVIVPEYGGSMVVHVPLPPKDVPYDRDNGARPGEDVRDSMHNMLDHGVRHAEHLNLFNTRVRKPAYLQLKPGSLNYLSTMIAIAAELDSNVIKA